MSDKIELLKKVEIAFHEKYEQRQIYAYHNAASLKNKETIRYLIRKGDRVTILQEQ